MLDTRFLRRARRAACTALLLGLSAAAVRAQTTYTVIDLGTLGGTSSGALAVNSKGQVVGYSLLSGGNYHAFLYDGTKMRDLGTLGGGNSVALAINASGQVVGYSFFFNSTTEQSFFYSGGALQPLSISGNSDNFATGINLRGQITGSTGTPSGDYSQAFLYSDSLHPLGTLGGQHSTGSAINAGGQITGNSNLAGDNAQHAFRYDGTKLQDLGTLGGSNSAGYGINDSGQITGFAITTIGYPHAFRTVSGVTGLQDIGTLGGLSSYGQSINTGGQIVGYSTITGDLATHAFLYDGTMRDLNALISNAAGTTLNYAYGISDNGLICGKGNFGGQDHAFLLRPNNAAISGRIALEGVPDLTQTNTTAAPISIHLAFRTHGTTTELFGADVALTPTGAGKAFGTFSVPTLSGTYDVAVKASKSLRVVVPNVTVGSATVLPDVTLPGGDATGDNRVDIGDFGLLVNAFNSDFSIPGSGYDPAADFNYDGVIDIGDFGVLVNEYNRAGTP